MNEFYSCRNAFKNDKEVFMSRKKILIVYPGSIFPIVMACQIRVLNMIRSLSQKHSVYFISQIAEKSQAKYRSALLKYCKNVKLILASNKESMFKRGIYKLLFYLCAIFKRHNSYYFYANLRKFRNAVIQFINSNNLDVIQVEYWFVSGFLNEVNRNLYLSLDTHDVLYEKSKLAIDLSSNIFLKMWKLYFWRWEKQKEIETWDKYDSLIAISKVDRCKIRKVLPHKNILVIPMGVDTSFFQPRLELRDKNTIIFYGAMSGGSNVDAMLYLWNNILPLIQDELKIKLIIVGSNPPKQIRELAENDWVEVTGYVQDVREYIGRGSVMVLPLRLGAGFRSRVCEVMAMEVPVVGTHNALDSIECTHKKNAIVSDNPVELAEWTVKILQDDRLREKLGTNGRKLIVEKFSKEATYEKLSAFYSQLKV